VCYSYAAFRPGYAGTVFVLARARDTSFYRRPPIIPVDRFVIVRCFPIRTEDRTRVTFARGEKKTRTFANSVGNVRGRLRIRTVRVLRRPVYVVKSCPAVDKNETRLAVWTTFKDGVQNFYLDSSLNKTYRI